VDTPRRRRLREDIVTSPLFRRLTAAESRALLRASTVGRLAFVNRGEVDIEPIHYVYGGKWLFGRTGEGSKLSSLARVPYVAFEVDEVEAPFDWRSVVVKGTYYPLDGAGSPTAQRTFARAKRLLRALVPDTLSKDDPTPFRDAVFGIYIDRLEGRMAATPARASRGRKGNPRTSSS
jgi:uncharacterized protein